MTCIICNCNDTFKIIREIHKEYFNKYKIIKSSILLEDIQDTDEQDKIINDYHTKNNHRGILEIINHLTRTIYFDNLKTKVTKIVNNCEICQENKYERHPAKQKLTITESPKRPMEILHIDIFHIDKLNILTILDKFSRFAAGQILESRTSLNIIDCLLNFFANRGIPNKIITDNAKEFTSSLFKEILNKYNILHHVTTQKKFNRELTRRKTSF